MKEKIETKKGLRTRILIKLRKHREEERLRKSSIIRKKFFRTREFKRAKTVLFYASFDGEVDTFEMIKQAKKLGKKIGLPRILRGARRIVPVLLENIGELEAGTYGIKNPPPAARRISLEDIDMVVVPGVAFDKHKNRLGRGAGYYDRFLKKLPSGVPTIGLAFDFQIVDCLPKTEAHDVPVTHLIHN